MYLQEIAYAHQGCIFLFNNTVEILILWNIITI